MADFKTHTLAGSVVGLLICYYAASLNLISEYYYFILIYIISIIGSFLPDVDHDSSKPLRIVFTFFAIISSISCFFVAKKVLKMDLYDVFIYTLLTFFIVSYFVRFLFKKYTKHRGIFHSLPMMLIVSLSTMFLNYRFGGRDYVTMVIGLATGTGFLSHLVLDELFATKNFAGIPYSFKKSFGDSFKVFVKSRKVNICVFAILVILFILNKDIIKTLFHLI
jgi:FtsH-binding integral membrane protein